MKKTAPGNRTSRRRERRAFTLIELLIAIAILLAIGGLVVVNLLPKKAEADVNLTRAQIDSFDGAMELFMVDMNRYPTEDEGLAALWSRNAIEDEEEQQKWKGPYLKVPKPKDTWGSEWTYEYPSEERPGMYKITSIGPDREEGTDDDITNFDRYRNEEGELSEDFDDFGTGADTGTGTGG